MISVYFSDVKVVNKFTHIGLFYATDNKTAGYGKRDIYEIVR